MGPATKTPANTSTFGKHSGSISNTTSNNNINTTTRQDTTRPVAAAAIAPHLAIAMSQHHRHRPPSHPSGGTSQVTAWSAA
jgi:hypothetical protein